MTDTKITHLLADIYRRIERLEAAEQRVRALHNKLTEDVVPWECENCECNHEDKGEDCPDFITVDICVACTEAAQTIDDCAPVVLWPCDTTKALDDPSGESILQMRPATARQRQ